MPGRRRRPRWLTEHQRQGILLALAKAHIPQEFSPYGYEDIRSPLWTDLTAWRTLPEWEDFEFDLTEMRNILWRLITGEAGSDAAGLTAIIAAAANLDHAWEIASGAH